MNLGVWKAPQDQNQKMLIKKKKLQKWKERFMNLFGIPQEITNKLTEEIIYGQLDIKQGHFTLDELDTILKRFESRKV